MTTSKPSFSTHMFCAVALVLFCGVTVACAATAVRQTQAQPYYAILAAQAAAAANNQTQTGAKDVRADVRTDTE